MQHFEEAYQRNPFPDWFPVTEGLPAMPEDDIAEYSGSLRAGADYGFAQAAQRGFFIPDCPVKAAGFLLFVTYKLAMPDMMFPLLSYLPMIYQLATDDRVVLPANYPLTRQALYEALVGKTMQWVSERLEECAAETGGKMRQVTLLPGLVGPVRSPSRPAASAPGKDNWH